MYRGPGGGPGGPGRGPFGPGRGPGFGGGFFGGGFRGGWDGGWGRKFPGPVRPAPGGNSTSTGTLPSASIAEKINNFAFYKDVISDIRGKSKLHGSIVGFIGASRLSNMGNFHYNLYLSRTENAKELYDDKRIDLKTCQYRQLKAAAKYHKYLYKLGMYTEEDYIYQMDLEAKKFGASSGDGLGVYMQVLEEEPIRRR